jgi:hypothetical protein
VTVARKQVGWGFWLEWVTASTIAFCLNATAIQGTAKTLNHIGSIVGGLAVSGVTLLVVGFLPGFLHWIILRRWVLHAGWWVIVSGVGSFLGFLAIGLGMNLAIGVAGGEDGPAYIMFPGFGVAFAFAGALAGTIQWTALRKWVARAGWWVVISSIGWAAAGLAYMWLTRGNDVALPLGGTVSGVLSGGITGLGIVWLLRTRSDPTCPV